jgi:hypothetical protein
VIKPYYTYIDPISGRALHAVSRSDYEKIQEGYGCPRCLEDYNGIWRAKCDVCGHTPLRESNADFVPVIPEFMIPQDYSLLRDPEESDYFDGVRSVS